MQKRRERIERKKKEEEESGAVPLVILPPTKKWSLEANEDEDLPQPGESSEQKSSEEEEKEDGDDDANKEKDAQKEKDEKMEEAEDDGVDPLDAYMQGVQEQVRQINKTDMKKMGKSPVATSATAKQQAPGKVTLLTGLAKKKDKKKGELIEQDQDALEHSSEEEKGEDLQTAMSGLQNKQKKLLQLVDHIQIQYIYP